MILSKGHRAYMISASLTEPLLSLYFEHTSQSSDNTYNTNISCQKIRPDITR